MKLASYALFLSLAGCSGQCGDQGAQARTSLSSFKAPPIPSFHADVLPVLALHCASAEGCHGDKPTPSVSLDLRASFAYGELVNKPSEGRRGAVRVKPGDPQASFLIDKLTGRLGPVRRESGCRLTWILGFQLYPVHSHWTSSSGCSSRG